MPSTSHYYRIYHSHNSGWGVQIFKLRNLFIPMCFLEVGFGIAQSIYRLATGWTARGSNPGRGEIFRTRPDRSWGPSSLLYNGYRVFPGGKAAGAWCWPPNPF
jgi:hypothetical protein